MSTPKLPRAKERVPLLLAHLEELYPDTGTALNFASPFQLLVATILSAQCTDAQVNKITPALFARFPTAEEMAAATIAQIIPFVKSTGFYRNKAKNIHGAATAIMTEYGGQVPGTLDQLVKLPGVGRKTANVVLGDGFGVTGITVDTHVGRLSRRLGLTRKHDPVKVEMVLNKLVPQSEWTRFSHRLILHGRAVCNARKPKCGECRLAPLCPQVGVRKPADGAT
ncbi:MAG: endonuclease III [Fimbriiglobus sp.]|jgi:endonuclease-3|nr:endonuclease III [Fimbriiglobus sp.]